MGSILFWGNVAHKSEHKISATGRIRFLQRQLILVEASVFVVYQPNRQNKKLNFVFYLQLYFYNTLFLSYL